MNFLFGFQKNMDLKVKNMLYSVTTLTNKNLKISLITVKIHFYLSHDNVKTNVPLWLSCCIFSIYCLTQQNTRFIYC